MTSSTLAYPSLLDLRSTIERHILDLYDPFGALKVYTSWPGYYTLPNGSFRPAVFITGAQQVPSNWLITGIECTIDDAPEDITSPGGNVSIETWLVNFTNYGTKEGTTMPTSMLEIRRRLARAFPRDRVTYRSRTEATYEAITARIIGAVTNPPIPT